MVFQVFFGFDGRELVSISKAPSKKLIICFFCVAGRLMGPLGLQLAQGEDLPDCLGIAWKPQSFGVFCGVVLLSELHLPAQHRALDLRKHKKNTHEST